MRFECLIYVTSLSGAEKAVAVEISGDIFAIHLALRKDIQQSQQCNISEPVVIRFGAGKMQSLAECIVTFCNESLNHGFLYTNIPRKFSSRASITAGKFMHTHTHERRKTLLRANLSARPAKQTLLFHHKSHE
jgi:hypothetical protein